MYKTSVKSEKKVPLIWKVISFDLLEVMVLHAIELHFKHVLKPENQKT